MTLWDKDSPMWKTLQMLFSVIGIGILVWHMEHTQIDSDAAVFGMGGTAVLGKLVYQLIKG